MRVAGIDSTGDWQFGRGKASYKTNSDAIAQNVVTRLRSFVNDWFLDITFGIDWVELLGEKSGSDQIKRAVEKMVLQTIGVKSISKLIMTEDTKNRSLSIELNYNDVFDVLVSEIIQIIP